MNSAYFFRKFKGIAVVLLFFQVLHSGAQTRAQLDSLRQEASVVTYSNPNLAIEKGMELYDLAKGDPSTQIGALIIIANGYAVLKNHENVLKYAFKADSIAEKSETYSDRIRVLGFIGGQYQRLNLNDKALNYLDQAYDISVQNPLPDSLKFLQGNILFVKGLIQKDNLGCEYALPFMEQAKSVFKDNISSKAINASIAISNNKIADCHFEMEAYGKAKQNYTQAIEYASKVNAIKSIAYANRGLANILSKQGQYEDAIKKLKAAFHSIEDVNDMGINSELLKSLSENYDAIGDTENFNKYTALYLAENEKLLAEEKKSLTEVITDLSTENSEERTKQKNIYTYLIIFLALVFLLLVYLIVKKILQKRRQIDQQRQEIDKSEAN